jgi:hypothetical protein
MRYSLQTLWPHKYLRPNQLIHFMEQSPSWEADSHSDNQEILRFL